MRSLAHRLHNLPPHKSSLGITTRRSIPRLPILRAHCRLVSAYYLCRIPIPSNCPVVNPNDAMGEAANLIELMAYEDDGAAGASDVAHFAEAFFLEVDVAHRPDFIHEENFRLEMCV